MINLEIFDSMGNNVKVNNLVKVKCNSLKKITFFAKVTIKEGILFPFDHFSFDYIEVIKNLPEDAIFIKSKNKDDFDYWYLKNEEDENEEDEKVYYLDYSTFRMNKFYKLYNSINTDGRNNIEKKYEIKLIKDQYCVKDKNERKEIALFTNIEDASLFLDIKNEVK